jgi:hypothetical protein
MDPGGSALKAVSSQAKIEENLERNILRIKSSTPRVTSRVNLISLPQ